MTIYFFLTSLCVALCYFTGEPPLKCQDKRGGKSESHSRAGSYKIRVKLSWIIATMLNNFTTGVNVFFPFKLKERQETGQNQIALVR